MGENDVLRLVHEVLHRTIVNYDSILSKKLPIEIIKQGVRVLHEQVLGGAWLLECDYPALFLTLERCARLLPKYNARLIQTDKKIIDDFFER